MPVVINDFEVVTEPPPPASPPAPASETQASQSAPTPREVQQQLRRLLERLARLKAD